MKKIRQIMENKNIDIIFLINFTNKDNNIRYFTNEKVDIGFLIIKKSNAKLFASPLEFETLNKDELKKRRISIFSLDNRIDKIVSKELSIIKKNKDIIIGVNAATFSLAAKELISKANKNRKTKQKLKFIDVGEDLIKIRSIKKDSEIKIIKKSCAISNKILESSLNSKTIKKIKTEKDLGVLIHKKVIDEGCTLAFDTIVASRANSSIPHHISSNTPIKKGFLLIDFGVKYNGYNSDMTRTIYIGKPTKKELEHYNLVKNSQKTATEMIREEMECFLPHNFVVKNFGKLKNNFIHSLGHGIGLDVHELPRIGPNTPDIFKKNMAFTNEPGLYFKNKYGIRIEDSLVIQNNKAKVITKMSKGLIKI